MEIWDLLVALIRDGVRFIRVWPSSGLPKAITVTGGLLILDLAAVWYFGVYGCGNPEGECVDDLVPLILLMFAVPLAFTFLFCLLAYFLEIMLSHRSEPDPVMRASQPDSRPFNNRRRKRRRG